MNLYLISQDVNKDYDTFYAAVVAAESEGEARLIHPYGHRHGDEGKEWCADAWCTPENVAVKLIGTAADGFAGVVCASYKSS